MAILLMELEASYGYWVVVFAVAGLNIFKKSGDFKMRQILFNHQ